VRRCLGKVQRLVAGRDAADQTLADGHAGDVDRLLRQAAGGKQLQHALAQQIDRADFRMQALADHLDHGVEFGLRILAAGHHFMQTCENGARRADGGGGVYGADRCAGHAHGLAEYAANAMRAA
jgi:hypothetical protein